ncbi:hypothetical protein [uncultured Sphingomonas sp.]|uniref:hypothetical protein n=1 Tax=uncultured Sphingomonas sp. TaxID=158754 RepID=UPI0025E94F77|nr:hypothetical protein [uncultured Sphingomonas sp.]
MATSTLDTTDTSSVTTTEGRQALFNTAKDAVTEAVQTAVDAVKANPKTAAAIAAGATAAVAGAAYGATKLATSKSSGSTAKKSTPAKRAPAKRAPAKSAASKH